VDNDTLIYPHGYNMDMSQKAISREQQGFFIAKIEGAIRRINELKYVVKSQNGNGGYDVCSTDLGWVCSCPDHKFRGVKCKHIFAVEISFALRKEVEVARIEPIDTQCCIYCQSNAIVRDGLRHNKYGSIQKFNCRECNRYFTINLGFEKMHATPQMVTSAMQLYFTGESLRNVQKFLKLQGVQTSHVSVYNWITKYVILMKTYLEKISPNVSDAWRADELYLKVKGDPKYLFALMDDQTRFWIAQQVADTKYTSNIQPLFKDAKLITGKRPNTVITDGAANFHDAIKKEFFTISSPRTRHISHIRLQGDHNNNKMERMNGEVRDREKTMRGLKPDTPILAGYQIYHNYFRPHGALKGKTPAEKCGIIIEGQDKWKTVIENATKNR
jgi:putative transposase